MDTGLPLPITFQYHCIIHPQRMAISEDPRRSPNLALSFLRSVIKLNTRTTHICPRLGIQPRRSEPIKSPLSTPFSRSLDKCQQSDLLSSPSTIITRIPTIATSSIRTLFVPPVPRDRLLLLAPLKSDGASPPSRTSCLHNHDLGYVVSIWLVLRLRSLIVVVDWVLGPWSIAVYHVDCKYLRRRSL